MSIAKKTGFAAVIAALGLCAATTQAATSQDQNSPDSNVYQQPRNSDRGLNPDINAVNPHADYNLPNARTDMSNEGSVTSDIPKTGDAPGGVVYRTQVVAARDSDVIGPAQVRPGDLIPRNSYGSNVNYDLGNRQMAPSNGRLAPPTGTNRAQSDESRMGPSGRRHMGAQRSNRGNEESQEGAAGTGVIQGTEPVPSAPGAITGPIGPSNPAPGAPGAIAPNTTEPGTTAPGTTTPGLAPGTTSPGMAPGTTTPGMAPGTTTPGAAPGSSEPSGTAPGSTSPGAGGTAGGSAGSMGGTSSGAGGSAGGSAGGAGGGAGGGGR